MPHAEDYTDAELKLAKKLGRSPAMVRSDLLLVQHYRANLADFFDDFFVVPGWLHGPLAEFERTCLTIMHTGGPRVFIVMGRGHNKTTRSRIYIAAMIALGLEPYIVGVAASDDNNQNNLDALHQVFTAREFAKVRRLASYFYGLEPVERSGNVLEFGGNSTRRCRAEFRSILGNMLGMNNVAAQGRPSLIVPDDIMPPEAYFSKARRRDIDMRMMGVIDPMGREGSRIVGNGTPMDAGDFIGRKLKGDTEGYVLNPPELRAAYDRQTGRVLWPERWTLEALEKKRMEFIRAGVGELFERHYMCSVDTAETKPLAGHPVHRYKTDEGPAAFPYHLDRVIVMDFSLRVGKDYTVIYELGMDPDENIYMLNGARSNTWDDDRLYTEVEAMVRFRAPNRIVIAQNTDSITFTRGLEKYLADKSLGVQIVKPHAKEFGNKNAHIIGRLQYPLKHGKIKAPTGAEWADWFNQECSDFEHDDEDNADDALDTMATGIAYLQKPEPMTAYLDQISSKVLAAEAAARWR